MSHITVSAIYPAFYIAAQNAEALEALQVLASQYSFESTLYPDGEVPKEILDMAVRDYPHFIELGSAKGEVVKSLIEAAMDYFPDETVAFRDNPVTMKGQEVNLYAVLGCIR